MCEPPPRSGREPRQASGVARGADIGDLARTRMQMVWNKVTLRADLYGYVG
jgi:hypothetical protein